MWRIEGPHLTTGKTTGKSDSTPGFNKATVGRSIVAASNTPFK